MGIIRGGIMSRAGVSRTQEEADADSTRIKEYRTLWRTGSKVSDLGTGDFDGVGPFRGLLDAGVNYIDTSESYSSHGRKIGEAIKDRDKSSQYYWKRNACNSG